MTLSWLYTLPWTQMLSAFLSVNLYNVSRLELNAIYQGKSPNKAYQAFSQLLLSCYLFYSVLEPHLLFQASSLIWYSSLVFAVGVPAVLYGTEWLIQKKDMLTPIVKEWFNRSQKGHLYLMNLSLLSLTQLGLSPITVALGLGLIPGMVRENGLLPGKLTDIIENTLLYLAAGMDWWKSCYISATFTTLVAASTLSHSISNFLGLLFQKFITLAGLILHKVKPGQQYDVRINKLNDRVFPKKPPRFNYHGKAKDLYQNIKGLGKSPHLRVSKYYVHHQKTKLPPIRENIDDKKIFEIFNEIDWRANHSRLKKEIDSDWSHQGMAFDSKDSSACKQALLKGLESYINAIRNNKLPATNPGTGMIANRYLDNIIFLLARNKLNKDVILSSLICMGIEGGQSCPNGKIRVLEDTFRKLSSEGDAKLPAKFRVASLLQTDRELFFKKAVHNLMQKYPYANFKKYFFHEQDTHYDNILIRTFGPNLGLPQLSATTELNLEGNGISKYFSAISPIEHSFWEHTSAHTIQSTCQASWVGKMCFSMSDYTDWFRHFVEKRINDSQDAKEQLEEDYEQYPKPDAPLKKDLLTLMLLDMGVLYLDNGNHLGSNNNQPAHGSSHIPLFKHHRKSKSKTAPPVNRLRTSLRLGS